MAALALTLLACRHRIVDYIIGRIDMKRRDALARQALVIKRKYRAARADEDWPNAMRLQQVYRRITGTIARLDRDMKAKEKAPGKVGNQKGFQVAQRLPTAQSCGLRRGTADYYILTLADIGNGTMNVLNVKERKIIPKSCFTEKYRTKARFSNFQFEKPRFRLWRNSDR